MTADSGGTLAADVAGGQTVPGYYDSKGDFFTKDGFTEPPAGTS
jgi:hypothetical protein